MLRLQPQLCQFQMSRKTPFSLQADRSCSLTSVVHVLGAEVFE